MKLTKKQLAALNRMIDRERHMNEVRKRDGGAGLHPNGDEYIGEKFAVSDGYIVVMFSEKPDGLPEAAQNDFLREYTDGLDRNERPFPVKEAPSVEECKRLVKAWEQQAEEGGSRLPKIEIRGTDEDWTEIVSQFDARLVIDAVEAMGTGAVMFLCNGSEHKTRYPYLTVYSVNGRGSRKEPDFTSRKAYVLPCRPEQ